MVKNMIFLFYIIIYKKFYERFLTYLCTTFQPGIYLIIRVVFEFKNLKLPL